MPALTLPAGYKITSGRAGYALHSDHFGEIGEGDFGCWAAARDAALDFDDAMAAEADPAEAEAAERAYNDILDSFHILVSQHLAQPIDDAETRGRRRAARALLAAIDSISAPAASQKAA